MGIKTIKGDYRDGSTERDYFIAKGEMWYALDKDDITVYTCDYTHEGMKENEITDIMTGKEFVEAVDSGSINNDDGFVSEVYVDDYVSNIGLICGGFISGRGFILTKDVFLELCDNHEVYVNWVNK